jgi:hypothetical protein
MLTATVMAAAVGALARTIGPADGYLRLLHAQTPCSGLCDAEQLIDSWAGHLCARFV